MQKHNGNVMVLKKCSKINFQKDFTFKCTSLSYPFYDSIENVFYYNNFHRINIKFSLKTNRSKRNQGKNLVF